MMGMRAKKICMAMLLIVGGIMAVFLAHRKVAEKITEEEVRTFRSMMQKFRLFKKQMSMREKGGHANKRR